MVNRRKLLSALGIAMLLGPLTEVFAALGDLASLPNVFNFRIKDVEETPGGDGSSFLFEFEALNWTNTDVGGLWLFQNVGTGNAVDGGVPFIAGNSIDPDGRGGPLGGFDIGVGVFDGTATHSGRGRGDIPGLLNDWVTGPQGSTFANWNVGAGGTPIPSRDLIGSDDPVSLVPGIFDEVTDALGDPAIDGGPAPYTGLTVGDNGGGQPSPDGSGNVLDGFVLQIDDFDVGETLSFNWFLTDIVGALISTDAWGNPFGLGIFSIENRPADSPPLPPSGSFKGSSVSNDDDSLFYISQFQMIDYDGAYYVGSNSLWTRRQYRDPEADAFSRELGIIPEPGALVLLAMGFFACGGFLGRRPVRGVA